MVTTPISVKASADDLDHNILLRGGHLDVAGQTQAAAENIRADVALCAKQKKKGLLICLLHKIP
jgi:hypothetical protein